jgi:hypothetical protein
MKNLNGRYVGWYKERKILANKDIAWRLKSKALWLEKGDESSKFFHQFANYRKYVDIIWKVTKNDGFYATSFEDIARTGVEYFWEIHKEESRVNSVEEVQMTFISKFCE